MVALAPLVLIAAGGTGGHVFPGLAVAQELQSRGYRVAWVGTARGLEHRVVPAAGLPLHRLPVYGLRGKRLWHKLRGVLYLGIAALGALALLLRLRPRCVVGMGGYVAGPVGVVAWLLRRPLLIHEQNAVAGSTNRLLAPLASIVATGFAGAFAPGVPCRVLGNPLRRELVAAGAASRYDFDGVRPLHLLVLGGSLGAAPINDIVPAVARRLERSGQPVAIWHQTGAAHADAVQQLYGPPAEHIRVMPFIEDMAAAYDWADLVLCRAGALTVAELAVMGRPAILVPLPHAIDDHQSANARALTAQGAAITLQQSEMDVFLLADRLCELARQPQQLAAMAAAARAAAAPEAAARVGDCCEELMHAR